MKKIISFSLWGSNHGYCVGAIENAQRIPAIYPGWTPRFYCDPIVPKNVIEQLIDLGSEIVAKPKSDDFSGLYWRFEPMFDDGNVERFIVRDTDSRVNAREADAVKEWEESRMPFHVMRDNPSHTVKIMGGMWGAVSGSIPEFSILMKMWLDELKPNPDNPRGRYHGTDQIFLERMIWPYMELSHLAHIGVESVRATVYDKQFRTKLKKDGYVGMIYSREDADRVEAL